MAGDWDHLQATLLTCLVVRLVECWDLSWALLENIYAWVFHVMPTNGVV